MGINKEVLLDGLKQYFDTEKYAKIIEEIKSAGIIGKITRGLSLVPLAVGAIEKVYMDLSDIQTGGGKEKKDAVVEWLDDIIEGNFIIEMIDGKIISMAVDGLVLWLNITKGKLWLDVSKDFLGIE